MEKTLMQKTGTVIYQIGFDFTSAEQKVILEYLQANNYSLVGYKGASGPNQVSSGVPTWFSISYYSVFGQLEIDYEPKYKVYVFNKADITINTTIMMQALSDEVPLGAKVYFNPDGSFRSGSGGSEGMITVQNNRPAGTPPLTIGLAAKVNGRFLPFCAFTCTPQGIVNIKPNEKIALFAAQTNATPGSVVNQINNPGCSFMFSAQDIVYDLQMISTTNGITNAPGALPVTPLSPGSSLGQILNSF